MDKKLKVMRYTGGKSSPGTYHKIINQIPKHKIFIEPYWGGGSITTLMKPSEINIGVDADPGTVQRYGEIAKHNKRPLNIVNNMFSRNREPQPGKINLFVDDGLNFVKKYSGNPDVFYFVDPPYLGYELYNYNLKTEAMHKELIDNLKRVKGKVMLCGYASELYFDLLAEWRLIAFEVRTRGGNRIEHLWMNYDKPKELHDYQYFGESSEERWNFTKRMKRTIEDFKKMPELERKAIFANLSAAGIDFEF